MLSLKRDHYIICDSYTNNNVASILVRGVVEKGNYTELV